MRKTLRAALEESLAVALLAGLPETVQKAVHRAARVEFPAELPAAESPAAEGPEAVRAPLPAVWPSRGTPLPVS